MHIEIQIALNFIISYLFNKLPRRRVNMFGEELDKAIRAKFAGHWYPEYPAKGSAYRCIRVAGPPDPVLSEAARESGLELSDVLELLPAELNVWADPGEVSYRIGEKSMVKILYSAADEERKNGLGLGLELPIRQHSDCHRDVRRTFNPDAQCFEPIIDPITQAMNLLNLDVATLPNNNNNAALVSPSSSSSSPSSSEPGSPSSPVHFKCPASPAPPHTFPSVQKQSGPVTFTAGSFAATKFGSTKLKSSGRRSNRLSPTELSHYIKQRTIMQQQHAIYAPQQQPNRSRSISPNPLPTGAGMDPFLFMQQHNKAFANNNNNNNNRSFFDNNGLFKTEDHKHHQQSNGLLEAVELMGMGNHGNVDSLDLNLNALPYLNQYQHLLVAN